MQSKICILCKDEKDFSKFYKKKDSKDGYRSICKKCGNEQSGKWNSENKEKCYKSSKKYRDSNPEKIKEISRNTKYKINYGITISDFNSLYESQGNKCAICGISPDKISKNICVDHDHSTGKIRGLLCRNCNSGLGLFSDNKNTLNNAIKYLETP